MLEYAVPIAVTIAFSILSGVLGRQEGTFSTHYFMATLAVCIAILVWIPIICMFWIILSVLLIVLMVFMPTDSGGVTT